MGAGPGIHTPPHQAFQLRGGPVEIEKGIFPNEFRGESGPGVKLRNARGSTGPDLAQCLLQEFRTQQHQPIVQRARRIIGGRIGSLACRIISPPHQARWPCT